MDDCVSEGEGAMARWTSGTSSDPHPTCHTTEQALWIEHCTQSAYPHLPGPQFPHLCNGGDHPCPTGHEEQL